MSDDWIRYRELVLQAVKDLREGIAAIKSEISEARLQTEVYYREQGKLSEKVKFLEQRLNTLQKALDDAVGTLRELDADVDSFKLSAAKEQGKSDVRNNTVSLKLGLVLFVLGAIGLEVLKWLAKKYLST